MPSHSRRSFLSDTALTLTALTGVLDVDRRLAPSQWAESALLSDLEALLEPVPSSDADDGELAVVHAGGDSIDVADLSVVAPPAVRRPIG